MVVKTMVGIGQVLNLKVSVRENGMLFISAMIWVKKSIILN